MDYDAQGGTPTWLVPAGTGREHRTWSVGGGRYGSAGLADGTAALRHLVAAARDGLGPVCTDTSTHTGTERVCMRSLCMGHSSTQMSA